MTEEKLRRTAYSVVSIVGVVALLYLFLKYAFSLLLPFLLAWALAFVVRRPAAFISAKTGIKEGIARLVLALSSAIALIAVISFGVWQLSLEIWRLLQNYADSGKLEAFISEYLMSGGIISELSESISERLGEMIYDFAVSLLGSLAEFISGIAGAVPKALLKILVTVIASMYFAFDLERINRTVLSVTPGWLSRILIRLKNGFVSVGLKYIKSYSLLMLITFSIMLLGLCILRVPYAILVSLVVAVLDVLPLIGVGTVLVPWSVFLFITGNRFLAVGILVLFVVVEIIRQTIEPRILGKNLGVHPLVTLFLLYVGYSVFGFAGLVLVPVFTVVIDVVIKKDDATLVSESQGG